LLPRIVLVERTQDLELAGSKVYERLVFTLPRGRQKELRTQCTKPSGIL
jgi:hypothetical protein